MESQYETHMNAERRAAAEFIEKKSFEGLPSWLKLHKTLGTHHHVFKYGDEYGRERFYTAKTYDPGVYQSGRKTPYESLGFYSDANGNPLCEDADPFNCGEVNNCGSDGDETHWKTIFDLSRVSPYWWDVLPDEEE